MVVAGRHTEVSACPFIETTRRTETRVINGCGHISSLPQTALEAAKTNCVGVLPGRNSQNTTKQAQQTKRADAGLSCEGLEGGAARVARADGITRFNGMFDPATEAVDQRAFRRAE